MFVISSCGQILRRNSSSNVQNICNWIADIVYNELCQHIKIGIEYVWKYCSSWTIKKWVFLYYVSLSMNMHVSLTKINLNLLNNSQSHSVTISLNHL